MASLGEVNGGGKVLKSEWKTPDIDEATPLKTIKQVGEALVRANVA